MKPSENEISTFMPGNDERLHSDTATFNSAGNIQKKSAFHPKAINRPKQHPVRARTSKASRALRFPNTGKVVAKNVGNYSIGDQIKYRFNPGSFRGKGGYEFYNKGTTHLVGAAKTRFENSVEPVTGGSSVPANTTSGGCIETVTLVGTAQMEGKSVTGCKMPSNISSFPVPATISFHPNWEPVLYDQDGKQVRTAPQTFHAVDKDEASNNLIDDQGRTFRYHDTAIAKSVYTAANSDTGDYNDEGDYNAAGNDKHYAGRWTFTRSLSLYYWDVKEKTFKMYANDPAHVMKGGLPFKVSSHTDTPTHKFYHVFAPGFDTQNIWIPASAMAKYAKQYVAASDTGDYNAEGDSTPSGNSNGETPMWLEVLPIVGLGLGLFAAHKLGAADGSKAVIGQYVAFGACGMGLFSIPKFYVQMKSVDKALSQFGKK